MAVKYTRKVQRLNAGNNTALKTVTFYIAGNQSVGTRKFAFVMPEAGTYVGTKLQVGTAPASTALIADVNKNGTTLYTTQGRRPTIAAAGTLSTESATANVTTLAANDVITVDVDQIGTGTVGADMSINITYLANAV